MTEGRKRCCLCGRSIIPGLEMWIKVKGELQPCHRDCGIPKAAASPEPPVKHLKRNLSDFKRYCQLMDKACGGSLDAYIVSWINGDGDINGASARGRIDDIAALVAAVIFQSTPYEYQLSVMENAKESLINLRIAHNLEKVLKENDQG